MEAESGAAGMSSAETERVKAQLLAVSVLDRDGASWAVQRKPLRELKEGN